VADFIAPVLICLCFPLLLAGFRRDRLGRVLTASVLTAGTVCLVAFLAATLNVEGAQNFEECWPACTTWQDGVGWAFWLGLIALADLLLVITLRGLWSVLRR
jgi:hypothetical protein